LDAATVALRGVSTIYEGERVPALREISCSIDDRSLVGIVGPNGAGKTTLLEVINGLVRASVGEVAVLGAPVSSTSHRLRREIAYLPQDLFFEATTPFLARDVVLMGCFGRMGVFRFPRRADRDAARDAMTAVGIDALAARPIGRLSGGQQRKVLLARVLARRPRVLLLDEPTTNLDPESKEEVSQLVLRIHGRLGLTTLVVSHEAGLLIDAVERVLTLVRGRLVSDRPQQAASRGATGVATEERL